MERDSDSNPEDTSPDCEVDGSISSDVCETTNPGIPITELLVKAKKAASSLWTVLHAQSCASKNTSSVLVCDYPGCEVTKRLLGHIKSCPAAFDVLPCPNNVQGCQTIRKLVQHYKTCRHSTYTNGLSAHTTIRTNRSSPTSTAANSNVSKRKQHQCLVCSLVARHARNALMMEGRGRSDSFISMFASKSSSKATMVHVPTKLLVHEADRSSSRTSNQTYDCNISGGSNLYCDIFSEQDLQRNTIPSPPLDSPLEPQQQDSITAKLVRSESMKLMPPPPPRPSSLNHQQQYNDNSVISTPPSSRANMEFTPSTPPTYRQLLHPAMVSAAACVSIPRISCTKITFPHRTMQPHSIDYTSGAPYNQTNDDINERPMYRRPRSQSIDDQLYNQFRKMGGSSVVVTSRSTSDLSQHDAFARAGTQSTLYCVDGGTDAPIFVDGDGTKSPNEKSGNFFF